MKRSSIATLLLLCLGISLLVVLYLQGEAIRVWNPKLFEALWNLLALGLGGGAVAFLFGQYSKEREGRERDRTIQREIFKEIVIAYGRAKKVQRLMRARAICHISDGEVHVLCDEYDKLFDDLNDARFSFEAQIHQIAANSRLFPNSRRVMGKLRKMEEYLALTIQEHQRELWRFSDTPRKRLLSDLHALEGFLGYNDQTKEFRSDFKYPFREVMEDFGSLLISP